MDPPVRLYNVDLSEQELDALLEKIRSSPYIDEVESGEEPRESSPLYNEVEPTKDRPPGDETSTDALLKHAGNPKVLAVAKKANKDQSVLIVEVKSDGSREELLVAPRDVIEVCCNCRISNMDLAEFKALTRKTGSDVYDSQR